jgi:hypothetical protein
MWIGLGGRSTSPCNKNLLVNGTITLCVLSKWERAPCLTHMAHPCGHSAYLGPTHPPHIPLGPRHPPRWGGGL